jgi:hypothetical protein
MRIAIFWSEAGQRFEGGLSGARAPKWPVRAFVCNNVIYHIPDIVGRRVVLHKESSERNSLLNLLSFLGKAVSDE